MYNFPFLCFNTSKCVAFSRIKKWLHCCVCQRITPLVLPLWELLICIPLFPGTLHMTWSYFVIHTWQLQWGLKFSKPHSILQRRWIYAVLTFTFSIIWLLDRSLCTHNYFSNHFQKNGIKLSLLYSPSLKSLLDSRSLTNNTVQEKSWEFDWSK